MCNYPFAALAIPTRGRKQTGAWVSLERALLAQHLLCFLRGPGRFAKNVQGIVGTSGLACSQSPESSQRHTDLCPFWGLTLLTKGPQPLPKRAKFPEGVVELPTPACKSLVSA